MSDNESDCIADETTGLLWPKTWRQAYLLVVANFLVWLIFLIALTELWK